jgi:hypothetical protein
MPLYFFECILNILIYLYIIILLLWFLLSQYEEAKSIFEDQVPLQDAISIDQTDEGKIYNNIVYNILFLVHLIGTI